MKQDALEEELQDAIAVNLVGGNTFGLIPSAGNI